MKRVTITRHPQPAWRLRADYALFAEVDPNGDEPWYEQLAGHDLGDGRVEICCIPLVAYDMSLGDIVTVVMRPEGVFVSQLVERSGWFSYRVMVSDERKLATLSGELEALGALTEPGNGPLMGVAVEGVSRAEKLVSALDRLEAEGVVEWESAAR